MITIEDTAILLKVRKHGETSAIVQLLTPSHGLYHGVVRGAFSKKNRGVYQPGNLINARWSARMSEQLGTINGELLSPFSAHIMQSSLSLSVMSSLCALLAASLPERNPYPKLYDAALSLLEHLQAGKPDIFLAEYAQFELLLLAETGFGLDLTACAATGATEDLLYVSPKSGRAVSRNAGEPYRDKLLKLPSIFARPSQARSKALPLEGGGLGGGDTLGSGDVLTEHSRELRKNLTDAEKKLWHILNHKQMEGIKFRRQHPMGGKYIVDFVALEKKLIIELDGGQHDLQRDYDAKRTTFLEAEGFRVLRFWNNEVIENIEGVWGVIHSAITSPPSQPSPLKGEGEVLEALTLTGYFLEHWLFEAHHRKIPKARHLLCTAIEKMS